MSPAALFLVLLMCFTPGVLGDRYTAPGNRGAAFLSDDQSSQNFLVVDTPPTDAESEASAVEPQSMGSSSYPSDAEQPSEQEQTVGNAPQASQASMSLVSAHAGVDPIAEDLGPGESADTPPVTAVTTDQASLNKNIRPGSASGVVDLVTFGLYMKSFFGTKLKSNHFKADVVLQVQWKDVRAASLVPPGMTEITMSGKQALASIWMPEVTVTNRDIRQYELISSGVKITSTGDVTKVERVVVGCNQRFDLEEYPFDTQKLPIKVASTKYMSDQVVLQPNEDTSASGVKSNLMKGMPYELEEWKVYAYEEADGALKKSRGVLEITARRKVDKYAESHLLPTMLLVIISSGVFWFPFLQPFITPRLALSVLALLTFTNLKIRSDDQIPDGAAFNWNDCLNYNIQVLMFITIVLNIFAELTQWHLELKDVAQVINHECKFMMPTLAVIVISTILISGRYKVLSVHVCAFATKVIMIAIFTIYMGCSLTSLSIAHREKEHQDGEKKREEAETKRLAKLKVGGGSGFAVGMAGV